MKRITFLMLTLAALVGYAQKPVKPNTKKALDLWQSGKINEAKDMIDAATTYEKTMNDGKTWYYRGLIYTSIDTTSNTAFKSLDPNAFEVAMKSFAKADSMKGKSEYFIQRPNEIVPVTEAQQMEILSNFYLDKGIKQYQDEQDSEASLKTLNKSIRVFEKNLEKYPNDTVAYFVSALVANGSDKPDLALENSEKYFAKGGKSRDIYIVMYQIYNQGPKEDKEKALEVIRRAKKALPNEPTFPKIELEMLINMGKETEAKAGLEEAIKKEPNDKILHFFLGYINMRLNNYPEARKNFEDAIKIDPGYYEAHYNLANCYISDVDKVSKELSATGNTPADSKKRSELVQKRVKVCESTIPYFERVEKMKAPDKDQEIDVLQKLSLLYYYVADDKNSARVAKKLKALGVEE
jgi:tetratricopeptide (TPR) repeat protein